LSEVGVAEFFEDGSVEGGEEDGLGCRCWRSGPEARWGFRVSLSFVFRFARVFFQDFRRARLDYGFGEAGEASDFDAVAFVGGCRARRGGGR